MKGRFTETKRVLCLVGGGLVFMNACATVTARQIDRDLEAMGLAPAKAACIANKLRDTLSAEDLQDLAQYTRGVRRAQSPAEAVEALLKIKNPKAAAAITKTILPCSLK